MEMLEKWDEAHKHYVQKAAWIKTMLAMKFLASFFDIIFDIISLFNARFFSLFIVLESIFIGVEI